MDSLHQVLEQLAHQQVQILSSSLHADFWSQQPPSSKIWIELQNVYVYFPHSAY